MTPNHAWVRRTELAQTEAKRVELHRARRLQRRHPHLASAVRSFVDRVTAWFRRFREAVERWAASVRQAFNSFMPVLEPVAKDVLRQRLADDIAALRDVRAVPGLEMLGMPSLPSTLGQPTS